MGTPPQYAAPGNFRVSDVKVGSVSLAWDGEGGVSLPTGNQHNSTIGTGLYRYRIKRGGVEIGTTIQTSYTDNFSFTYNTLYTYEVIPETFAQNDCCVYATAQRTPASLYVMMDKIYTTAASSVDSRLDYRKNPVALRNYRFGYSLYKGGLFVGYVDDPSKVARTFLKFSVPLPPYNVTDVLWSGRLYAYLNENHKNSVDYVTDPLNPPSASVTMGAHFCSDTSWLQNGIHWGNAPTFNATPTASVLVPISLFNLGQWLNWRIDADVAVRTGSTLTEVLKAADETQASWKYFAKKEFSNNNQIYILRATGRNTTP